MSGLPSTTVRVLEGLPSIDGKKVSLHASFLSYDGWRTGGCPVLILCLGHVSGRQACACQHHTVQLGDGTSMGAMALGILKGTLLQATTCSICLEDFNKGQRVRELPKCGHVYHAHCVDRWLRMHNACPLCRVPAL